MITDFLSLDVSLLVYHFSLARFSLYSKLKDHSFLTEPPTNQSFTSFYHASFHRPASVTSYLITFCFTISLAYIYLSITVRHFRLLIRSCCCIIWVYLFLPFIHVYLAPTLYSVLLCWK